MPSSRLLVALTSITLAVSAPVAAAAVSHAKLWQNKKQTVDCGIKIHPATKPASQLLCSAVGLPHPTKGFIGDPFVQISAHGKPHIVPISQNSFVSDKLVTLKNGQKWQGVGVSCVAQAKTVKCTNQSGHGFKIGHDLYKKF